MKRVFHDYGAMIVTVIAVVALIGLTVFLMRPGSVMANAFSSITGQFVDAADEMMNPTPPDDGLPPDTETIIYRAENLDPNTIYEDFFVTGSNRSKIGYTDETVDLIIPAAFYDVEANKWYKVVSIGSSNLNDAAWSDYPFSNCDNLKSVYIPGTIIDIGNRAFRNSFYIETIVISNSVTTIGPEAFGYCGSNAGVVRICYSGTEAEWNAISFLEGNLQHGHFFNYVEMHYNYVGGRPCLSNFTANDLAKIGYDGSMVETLVIPSTIINASFASHNIVAIAPYALENCSASHVVISDGVTAISDYAFYGCTAERLTIPKSITSMDNWALDGFWYLEKIIFEGTVEEWNDRGFNLLCDLSLSSVVVECSNGTLALS